MASVQTMAEIRMIFMVVWTMMCGDVWLCGNEKERLMMGGIVSSWEMGRSDE
jgi:hypothetical protein